MSSDLGDLKPTDDRPALPPGWVPVTDGLYDTESGLYMLFHPDGRRTPIFPGWRNEGGWLLARDKKRTHADFWTPRPKQERAAQ